MSFKIIEPKRLIASPLGKPQKSGGLASQKKITLLRFFSVADLLRHSKFCTKQLTYLWALSFLKTKIHHIKFCCQYRWASLLCITLPKRYYHLPFFNLPGLQKPGRNHFPKNSYWGITDLGILVSQNNLWTNSLIRVQGDCPYILLSSFSKLF